VISNVSNVTIPGGNSGQVLTSTGNGKVAWSNGGSIAGGLSNGSSNVNIAVSGGPITLSSGGNANVIVVNQSNVIVNAEIWANGNIYADYFDGDGSRLDNINAANIRGNLAMSGAFVIGGRSTNKTIIMDRGQFGVASRSGIIVVNS
jgi:hypothetical protein